MASAGQPLGMSPVEVAAAIRRTRLAGPTETATILIADPHEINRRILRGILRSEPYRVLEATHHEDALRLLNQEKIDLIVLDLMLPEIGAPEFCRRVKLQRHTRLVPLLVITSVQGVENEIAGLESGADEFLTKPLHPAVVRTRIAAMLRQKAAIDSLEEAEGILFALAQAIEQRDTCTGLHCERLALISVTIGQCLGLEQPQLVALYRGGFLHDIGKVSVPDAILRKPGPLTEEEWRIMRAHTVHGEAICRPLKTLAPVLPIVRHHHERWDGSGYPDGLRGEQIPLLARILQIADIFDALTSERPYKPALSWQEAVAILEEETRRGWRDPHLVAVFRAICEGKTQLPRGQCLNLEPDAVRASLENMRVALLQ
ncbi:MAG: HD domain-containing phosphohydrolase [Bryobacterales bacterium]|nr:HD domain-containing protein [Bryobacteraceae bacterium]MDW8131294.1 HD domain-containing phosphohydrolase [Bryobacterales bacterium]